MISDITSLTQVENRLLINLKFRDPSNISIREVSYILHIYLFCSNGIQSMFNLLRITCFAIQKTIRLYL
jgi:hypothetical protein